MFTAESIICSDKYLSAVTSSNLPIEYYKTELLWTGGLWRNKTVHPCTEKKGVKTVVLGHSDLHVTDHTNGLLRQHNGVKNIFAINNLSVTGNGLPLGITNMTNETALHPIYGNVEDMIHVSGQPVKKPLSPTVYMNINTLTNPTVRIPVERIFNGKDWVVKGLHNPSQDGRKKFLMDIRSSSFVVCPEGNGIDTHRLWESLYMETIPIVKKSLVHKDWEDLPVFWVKSWEDVNLESLSRNYEKLQPLFRSENTVQKLSCNYWIDKILKSATD
jgi:hypothetical protein